MNTKVEQIPLCHNSCMEEGTQFICPISPLPQFFPFLYFFLSTFPPNAISCRSNDTGWDNPMKTRCHFMRKSHIHIHNHRNEGGANVL